VALYILIYISSGGKLEDKQTNKQINK